MEFELHFLEHLSGVIENYVLVRGWDLCLWLMDLSMICLMFLMCQRMDFVESCFLEVI